MRSFEISKELYRRLKNITLNLNEIMSNLKLDIMRYEMSSLAEQDELEAQQHSQKEVKTYKSPRRCVPRLKDGYARIYTYTNGYSPYFTFNRTMSKELIDKGFSSYRFIRDFDRLILCVGNNFKQGTIERYNGQGLYARFYGKKTCDFIIETLGIKLQNGIADIKISERISRKDGSFFMYILTNPNH